ncbi:MAG: GFA family protein [Pseudomonadota bacterium]
MMTGRCHCGAIRWRTDFRPETALSCNCSICHRYGAIWAYGVFGKSIHVAGDAKAYVRDDEGQMQFLFCPTCGCMTHHLALVADEAGNRRCAVNLRMADFESVSDIPITRFDGAETWSKRPSAGLTIGDIWH